MLPDNYHCPPRRFPPASALVGYGLEFREATEPHIINVISLPVALSLKVKEVPIHIKFGANLVQSLDLHIQARSRTVQVLHFDIRVRSYCFPVSEPSFVNLRQHYPADAASPSHPSEEYDNPVAVKARYKLPRDTLRTQDRLLLLLQPPAPIVFRQRRLPLPTKPYPYQWQGIAFLLPRHSALLADEMGLGKTIQAILSLRLLFHLGEVNQALIVCPKALVPNWTKELQSWAPEIPYEIIAGDIVFRQRLWCNPVPIKITNYETVVRDRDYLLELGTCFDVIIADEAQRIKNRESQAAQALCQLPRMRSWALTGTPLENRLEDLVSIFHFIKPNYIRAEMKPQELRDALQDYILRRTKDQVAPELPPKVYRDIPLELTCPQAQSYRRAKEEGVVWLRKLGRQVTINHLLALIQRLKQICNFDPETGESAKLEQLQADLLEVSACGRKAIVFSQWVETLNTLAEKLSYLNPVLFHGKLSACQRWNSLQQFREDRQCHLILMTYGSGGVGLNLQCANYVFLFDRWWNPALEEQAIHRAHRLGQKESVIITRYLMVNTIESRIQEILDHKRSLFQQILDSQNCPVSSALTLQELYELFEFNCHSD